jgi:hypothetical protein
MTIPFQSKKTNGFHAEELGRRKFQAAATRTIDKPSRRHRGTAGGGGTAQPAVDDAGRADRGPAARCPGHGPVAVVAQHLPAGALMPIVLPIHAREGETIEIHWHTKDGTVHHQRVTCPPRATREAQVLLESGAPETAKA